METFSEMADVFPQSLPMTRLVLQDFQGSNCGSQG
jgi:hypothetical protein